MDSSASAMSRYRYKVVAPSRSTLALFVLCLAIPPPVDIIKICDPVFLEDRDVQPLETACRYPSPLAAPIESHACAHRRYITRVGGRRGAVCRSRDAPGRSHRDSYSAHP